MEWRPQEQRLEDDFTAAPLDRLAAMLDHDAAHWAVGEVPPLGHWLFFLPAVPQSSLAPDGHPQRGSLLPPSGGRRRMWAGGRLTFHAPLRVGARAERRSHVVAVEEKSGRSGPLTFVTVAHEIRVESNLSLVEEQDVVYRSGAGPAPAPAPSDDLHADDSRELIADEVMLFRYSALTFNAHRIHYDRPYALHEEGYPSLVVHGPLQATLLVDHLLRHRRDARLATFEFRGMRPLFAGTRFSLNLRACGAGFDLWTRDADGQLCMRAAATLHEKPE